MNPRTPRNAARPSQPRPSAARRAPTADRQENLPVGSCNEVNLSLSWPPSHVSRLSARGGGSPLVGGGRSMLSVFILSLGLAPASPGENPAELAAWIDARLEATWRAKDLPARPPAGDGVFLRRAYL